MITQPAPRSLKLGFIGAGKLSGSVMRGLLRSKFCNAHQIIASEPMAETREKFSRETGIFVTSDNREIARTADVIFIAVKPGTVLGVISEIAVEARDKAVISLAAGTRLTSMEAGSEARFMRAMTNTPSAICQGATAIAPGSLSTPNDLKIAREIFNAIGVVVEISEDEIDAVTALSGSGPAFVYSMIEALADGGAHVGLRTEVALKLAAQTVLGAAQLMRESEMSPEELRRMVVTPGGTTAAGLAAMEKLCAHEAIAAAVEAATKRGREMAAESK